MEKVKVTMTVLFEEPFWIGIYEREDGESYQAAKILFGAEPKGLEVQEYLLKNVYRLSFGTGEKSQISDKQTRKNPKRMQREIRKQTRERGTGTAPSKPYRHSGKSEKSKSASSERKISWQRKKNGFCRNNRRNAKNIVDTKRRNAS